MSSQGVLKRHLTVVTLTFYGVGVIVGAGIYVLVGKLAGISGNAVWLAFLVSAVAALPTGLSYAELASRYPRSAGEAVFAERAFGKPLLSFCVGFLILASGIASTAALSHGFAGYFGQFVSLHPALIIALFLAVISWVNARGIKEATWVNVLCTVVSVGALIVLVACGISRWGSVDYGMISAVGDSDIHPIGMILSGAALAFYAYIGFEDICNVAEEVRRPQRTIPQAILWAMLVSTVLYVAVALTVVAVATPQELSASNVPLALVASRLLPQFSSSWLSGIALFAVFNSALLNMVMASRLVYGMARNGWIPMRLGTVHMVRQTPRLAVLLVGLLALGFALTGVLKVLAEATNVIILSAFFLVNLSLVVVHRKKVPPDDPDKDYFRVPRWVPYCGLVIAAVMVVQFSWGAYVRAGGLLLVGVILYGLHRWRKP